MKFKIIRLDGKSDFITDQYFENYDEAFDLLDMEFNGSCCSDCDFPSLPAYEIIVESENV
tara:strand:- start:300 stop:479 length:180 start_codon:yes stop_codon:yes gene_type:complete